MRRPHEVNDAIIIFWLGLFISLLTLPFVKSGGVTSYLFLIIGIVVALLGAIRLLRR